MSENSENILNLEGDALDKALMAAIEETEAEDRAEKEQKAQAEQERARRMREEAQAKEARKEELDRLRESLPNQGRRYFIMAEDMSCAEDGTASITGLVAGSCRKGDTVFVYRNDGRAFGTIIDDLEVFNGNLYEPSEEARQSKVRVSFKVDLEKTGLTAETAIPRFSVLSTAAPLMKNKNGKPVIENPLLTGLLFRYAEYNRDSSYISCFLTGVVNGRFLVPAVGAGSKDNAADADTTKKALKIIMFTSKDDPSKRILPLFTDVQALLMWKKIFEGENKPTPVVMNFADVAKFISREKFDIAFNPAGPVSVGLPAKTVTELSKKIPAKN